MEWRSTAVGGSTASGPALSMQKSGQALTPDFRLPVTNRPLGALTTNKELADKYSKSLQWVKDFEQFQGIEYLVSGIGSSNLVDTDGDVFHKSAIDGMARDSIDLNILLNHTPTLPWSLAGSVLETGVDYLDVGGKDYCVLRLLTDIEHKHPDAWRTYEMIAGIDCRPRKLGFSVGCLYVDARPRQTKNGLYSGADVFEVLPVEFSIVSMPANRLAWIELMTRDMQEKGMLPQRKGGMTLRQYAESQPVLEAITDWMDFGPLDGPKLERLAKYFEKTYGIVYARRPRSN